MCAAVVVPLSIGAAVTRDACPYLGGRRWNAVLTDVATSPASGCPPVCQRSEFPLGRNLEIILYCAVECKGVAGLKKSAVRMASRTEMPKASR